MIHPKCNLLSGPEDGKLVRIPRDLTVYFSATPAEFTLNPVTTEEMLAPPKRTRYDRTGPRTFVHESEKF